MPGEPSAAATSWPTGRSSHLLATLQIYYDALRRDGDSYAAWIGLSEVFAALDDEERVRNCRDVALRLQTTSPPQAALPH